MAFEPVLIAGEWRAAKDPAGSFTAENPATKRALPETYPVSSLEEVLKAIEAGQRAAVELAGTSPDKIADFLEAYASNIEARADELVELASIETALPKEPRLRSGELPRTTNQLRQAAAAARSRSWCQATIDTGNNIRSKMGPLGGPVVVFGPNNFPYAFNSVAGGDFAAAIAAGNPVIGKANPAHPGTTRVLAQAAFEAVKHTGLPPGTVQLIYRTKPDVGLKLVSHPYVGATGFTGSRNAGLKLKEAADKAGKPIYLEMSSVNPIFILAGALEERSREIATELFGSCALGAGQFCTNPGLLVVPKTDAGKQFVSQLAELFEANSPGTLLGASGPGNIADALTTLKGAGAELVVGGSETDGPGYAFQNTLLSVSAQVFLDNPEALQTEAFGMVSLIVFAEDVEQMAQVAAQLEGNLTGCLYSHTSGADDAAYDQIAATLRTKVGRLLNDKVPTGVAVVPSMNHGGPYPATGHPGFTAVGIPAAMLRFAALHCYDNVREHRLPVELGAQNPTGEMWRLIDGVWSQADLS